MDAHHKNIRNNEIKTDHPQTKERIMNMPRSNREYLLRYADQAINDMERALDRLKTISDVYGGKFAPMDGALPMDLLDDATEYDGTHGKYQQFVDAISMMQMQVLDELITFKKNFM